MSYSVNLVTVKNIDMTYDIVAFAHAASSQKNNEIVNFQKGIHNVLTNRKHTFSARVSFKPTLKEIPEDAPVREKIQNVVKNNSIFRPPLRPVTKDCIRRTTSGTFKDIIKQYWEKEGVDPFAILEEADENIFPFDTREKLSSSLKKSQFSFETLEALNKKKVGGFWEEAAD